jgi:hypothetical protein
MTQNRQNDSNKIQSPYPALQAVLPRLRALNPERNENRPVFDNKSKARLFIDIQEREQDKQLMLTPVWGIDHGDLSASEIRGWTATRFPC